MYLWCFKCGEVHGFKGSEVERIVYALQGQFCDSQRDRVGTVDTSDPKAGFDCLVDIADDYARDQEMYGEHVKDCVQARRENRGAKMDDAEGGSE